MSDSAENVLSVVDSAARAGAKFIYAAFGVTMRDGRAVALSVLLPYPLAGKNPVQAVQKKIPLAVPHGDPKGGVEKLNPTRPRPARG